MNNSRVSRLNFQTDPLQETISKLEDIVANLQHEAKQPRHGFYIPFNDCDEFQQAQLIIPLLETLSTNLDNDGLVIVSLQFLTIYFTYMQYRAATGAFLDVLATLMTQERSANVVREVIKVSVEVGCKDLQLSEQYFAKALSEFTHDKDIVESLIRQGRIVLYGSTPALLRVLDLYWNDSRVILDVLRWGSYYPEIIEYARKKADDLPRTHIAWRWIYMFMALTNSKIETAEFAYGEIQALYEHLINKEEQGGGGVFSDMLIKYELKHYDRSQLGRLEYLPSILNVSMGQNELYSLLGLLANQTNIDVLRTARVDAMRKHPFHIDMDAVYTPLSKEYESAAKLFAKLNYKGLLQNEEIDHVFSELQILFKMIEKTAIGIPRQSGGIYTLESPFCEGMCYVITSLCVDKQLRYKLREIDPEPMMKAVRDMPEEKISDAIPPLLVFVTNTTFHDMFCDYRFWVMVCIGGTLS